MIILKNARYLAPSGEFIKGDIFLEGTRIHSLQPEQGHTTRDFQSVSSGEVKVVDLEGKRVIPGLIDMHTHGAIGYDAATASAEEICEIARYHAQNGTTTFMPTTVTAEKGEIKEALRQIREASQMANDGATIEGAHIEGPYINEKRKGAHDPQWIRMPNQEDYDEFRDILGSLKIHITVAPEVEGGLELIKHVRQSGGTVGIGHTDGGYEMTMEAIKAGANVFTHLFNAMKGIHHREPGVVGTALASDVPVEVICDGIHLHPAIVKMVSRARGAEGVVLVTDSMHATGLGNGEYEFGGFKINVVDGQVRQADGTLAGSTLRLFNGVRNMMDFAGVSLEDAVRMATLNPARILGIQDETGTIEEGKRGDLIVLDEDTQIHMVFCRGTQVR